MKKRILSGVLAALMLCTLLPAAVAAQPTGTYVAAAAKNPIPTAEQAAQVLAALDIMVGDDSGNLNLGATVSRAEFVKMAVAATPAGAGVGAASTSPYPDVPKEHWAAGYVQAAVSTELVKGYLDGTFRPNNPITLAEGVTMILSLLGYQHSDFPGAYPSGHMAKYRDLKLDRGVTAQQTSNMTRQDCLYLAYNLLTAPSKTTGKAYIYTLGHELTPSGEIDLVGLINAAMEGPVVVEGNWANQVSFDPASARTVYRGGNLSSYSALQTHDVVYWSKSMRTLWAYTNQATGTITAITPSASAPTGVTVAGKSYSLETSSATYALSDLGTHKVGDAVTLLLGRSGGVAALADTAKTSSVIYGVVESVSPGSYTDNSGNSFTANTLTVRSTDGGQRTFRCDDKNIKADALVEVSTAGGNVVVKRLSSTTLTGKVNSAGTKLGSHTFAADVEILDVYDNAGVRVYPQRLAGVNLSDSKMVRYYRLNSAGEISHLILNDVTGDVHQYGVITEAKEDDRDMIIAGSYVYDVGGKTIPTGPMNKTFGVKEGPARFLHEDGELKSMTNLTSVKLTGLNGSQALASNTSYPMLDITVVYELRDGKYFLSSRSIVEGGDFSLTGYYDKAADRGGAIRVIVAKAAS